MTTFIKRPPIVLWVMLAAALFWAALFMKSFRTLHSPDQVDYAHLGLNLLQGRGFVTDVIFPLYLTRFPTLVDHPEFLRAPVFSVLVAGAEALLGQTDAAVVSVNGLFYVLMVGLVYIFARQLFASERVALISAAVVLLNQELVVESLSGLADLTFAFWLTLILYLVYAGKPAWLVGVAIGVGYLLRYNLLVMLPGLALFWLWDRPPQGWRYILIVLGVALIVIAPWLARNIYLSGSPTFAWSVTQYVMGTDSYPAQELYRLIESVDIMKFVLTHPGEMIRKSINGTRLLYNGLPGVTNFIVSAFFFASLFVSANKSHRVRALQYAALAMAACQALAVIPLEHERIRLFHAFIPVMCIFAVQFLDNQLSSYSLPRWATVAGLAGMVAFVAVPTLPEFTGQFYRYDFDQITTHLRESEVMDNPDAIIIIDRPGVVAWYLDRTAVAIPARYEDLQTIEALTDKPIYVFFYYVNQQDRYERADEYASQYFENESFLANHTLIQTFEDGTLLYALER